MINLLPDETKRDIRAARMNVILLRYNLLAAGAALFLALVCLLFYAILRDNQSQALSATTDNNSKAKDYSETRKEAEEYRNNLAIADKIIDNGISYTNAIIAITKLLPEGVIFDNLNLNVGAFGKDTMFAARAKDYSAANQLKTNFEKSDIFSDVHFQSISMNESESDTSVPYPITIAISAKLDRTAAE